METNTILMLEQKETNHNTKTFHLYSTVFKLWLCKLSKKDSSSLSLIPSFRTQFLSLYLWNSWHDCLHWNVFLRGKLKHDDPPTFLFNRTDGLDGNVKRQCLNAVCEKKMTDLNINYAQVKTHTCSTKTKCSTCNKKKFFSTWRMLKNIKMNDQ